MEQLDPYFEKLGPFQFVLHLGAFIQGTLNGIQILVPSFTLANPKARCKYDNETTDAQYDSVFGETQWSKLFGNKGIEGGKDVYCSYCPSMVINDVIQEGSCGLNFTSQACTEFVYDRSQYRSSISMEYDMICSSGIWKKQVAESLFLIGVMIGAALWGGLSDKFGRKKTYIICCTLLIICSNMQPFSPNYYVIYIFQVLIGCCSHGTYIVTFVIIMEYFGSQLRSAAGMVYNCYFTFGVILVGLMAYFIRDWVWLMRASSFPLLLLVPTFLTFPESYMWLASQNKLELAKQEIKRVCRINKVDISDKIIDDNLKLEATKWTDKSVTILDLFRHRIIAKYTIINSFFCILADYI